MMENDYHKTTNQQGTMKMETGVSFYTKVIYLSKGHGITKPRP